MIAPEYSPKDEELTQYESIRNPMRFRPPGGTAEEEEQGPAGTTPSAAGVAGAPPRGPNTTPPKMPAPPESQPPKASELPLQPKTEDFGDLASKLNLI